jgi:HEAT repeat protein
VKALKDKDPNVRAAVAGALGKIGDPKAAGPLLEALKDHDHSVRRALVDALGTVRDEKVDGKVVERLLPLLKDSDSAMRSAAARSLEAVGGDRLSDTHRAAIAVVRMKWDEAANIGPPAVEPLVGALSDPKSQVRVAAVNALGKIRDERSIQPLIDMLRDSDAHVQETAASALASIGDTRAVRPLVALAREGSVVTAAVKALDRLLGRTVQNIPDADLIEIAALEGPAPQGAGLARKELSRRGLPVSPPPSHSR